MSLAGLSLPLSSTSIAALLGLILSACGQAPAAIDVSVDATADGAPLEPVWPFYGYDEINYTTTPEGKALLGTLAAAHTAPVRVRSHFLLNTGDGVPAPKWGSTNVYTEDGARNPVYNWTLTDGILDTITAAGAFPFVEIGFMPSGQCPASATLTAGTSTKMITVDGRESQVSPARGGHASMDSCGAPRWARGWPRPTTLAAAISWPPASTASS